MTDKEIQILLHDMVEERVNKAFDKMMTFKKCEDIYNDMCKMGYVKEMQSFKNVILYTIIIHPEMSEEEVLMDIYKNLFKKNFND